MKIVKKNVYYCDHCKKKGLSALHIRNHEGRCTANPRRVCGACDRTDIGEVIDVLKLRFTLADNPDIPFKDDPFDPAANWDEKIVTWIGEPITLQGIRELVDDCPACILAVIRQVGLQYHYFHFEEFKFKDELRIYMSEKQQCHNPYGF